MSDIFPKDKASRWCSILCAVIVTVGLSVNLGVKSASFSGLYVFLNNMIAALGIYDIRNIFEVFLFYFLFLYGIGILKKAENLKKEVICAGLPALLFGVFMSIGYSYKSKGNWSLVFGTKNVSDSISYICRMLCALYDCKLSGYPDGRCL